MEDYGEWEYVVTNGCCSDCGERHTGLCDPQIVAEYREYCDMLDSDRDEWDA